MGNFIYEIFMVVVKAYSGYFLFVSLFSMRGKIKERKTQNRFKFAVLVAARNEEKCIGRIIDSVKNQDYPSELIDVYVIPNNCTDNTAGVAMEHGANILEVPSFVGYKGDALKFAVDELLYDENGYDVFAVFDADNEVNGTFFTAMNRTLSNGARVAKSRIYAKNRRDSWVATCYDIHFCMANLFLNRARVRLGLSARIIGTGFAVKSDYLREIGGFNTVTITEDAEFFSICAINGEKIFFCEDAISYDEEILKFSTSLIQRKRWMSGIMQVFLIKGNELVRAIFKKKSSKFAMDTFLQFSFAYIQAFIPFFFLLKAYLLEPVEVLPTLLSSFTKGYIITFLIALTVQIMEKRLILSKNVILGILLYPLFALSFIPIQTVSLFKKTKKWRYIEHLGESIHTGDREKIEEII